MPPGFDDSIKKIEAQASSGTATATAAITSGFAEMNTILVSTSFLDYIGE